MRASTLTFVWLLLVVLVLHLTEVSAELARDTREFKEWQEFKEFQEYRAWKTSIKERNNDGDSKYRRSPIFETEEEQRIQRKKNKPPKKDKQMRDPPPIDQVALMARYIVNQADWTSVATISSRKDTENYPFVNIISVSDGLVGNGSGIPYMYLTPLDYTAQDVFKDSRATLMMTLAQGRYCESKDYDPMDPRCARVVFSGKIKAVKEDNPEYLTAKNAVFGRHPLLSHMPEDHHFFFAKLKINTIAVLDNFGGPKYVSVKDYLHPSNADTLIEYGNRYNQTEEDDLATKSLQQPSAVKV